MGRARPQPRRPADGVDRPLSARRAATRSTSPLRSATAASAGRAISAAMSSRANCRRRTGWRSSGSARCASASRSRRRPDGLTMHLKRWSIFGIRLPLFLAPRIAAREWRKPRAASTSTSGSFPLIGGIVHYTGWLRPMSLIRLMQVRAASALRISEMSSVTTAKPRAASPSAVRGLSAAVSRVSPASRTLPPRPSPGATASGSVSAKWAARPRRDCGPAQVHAGRRALEMKPARDRDRHDGKAERRDHRASARMPARSVRVEMPA